MPLGRPVWGQQTPLCDGLVLTGTLPLDNELPCGN